MTVIRCSLSSLRSKLNPACFQWFAFGVYACILAPTASTPSPSCKPPRPSPLPPHPLPRLPIPLPSRTPAPQIRKQPQALHSRNRPHRQQIPNVILRILPRLTITLTPPTPSQIVFAQIIPAKLVLAPLILTKLVPARIAHARPATPLPRHMRRQHIDLCRRIRFL